MAAVTTPTAAALAPSIPLTLSEKPLSIHSLASHVEHANPLSMTQPSPGTEEGDVDAEGEAHEAHSAVDGKEEERGLLLPASGAASPPKEKEGDGAAGQPLAASAITSKVPTPTGPKVNIRILVISGQTHVFTFEPETTIGRVKDLIWNMWPQEWNKEPCQPPNPSYFRLLYLGRMLADDATLMSLNLRLAPAVTIVHLSVRTFELEPEEPIKKSLLPFSLRPATTRSNSANTAANIIPISVTNAANGIQPPAAGSPRTATGDPSTARSSTARRVSGNGVPQRAQAEDSHSGGCKCIVQ